MCLDFSGIIQSRSSRTNREHVSQSSDMNGSSALSGDQSSLQLLQDMLGQVEAELDTLGPDTGAAPWSQRTHVKQGLTGFSVALVSTLRRLVRLLKQVWSLMSLCLVYPSINYPPLLFVERRGDP